MIEINIKRIMLHERLHANSALMVMPKNYGNHSKRSIDKYAADKKDTLQQTTKIQDYIAQLINNWMNG